MNQSGKKFQLYRAVGESTAVEPVGDVETTDSNGKIRFTELPAGNNAGGLYTYYVVEQEQDPDDGFTWQTNATIRINGQNTPAVKIGSFTETSSR